MEEIFNYIMEITEYFSCENKEHWRREIPAAQWSAAGFLVHLLGDDDERKKALGEYTKLFLMTDGTKLASFCVLSQKDCIEDDKLFPWIGFVFTFPEYRGKRFSEKLIAHAENTALKNGWNRVYIATDHIGLYEKYGYAYMETRKDCWGESSRIYYKDLII